VEVTVSGGPETCSAAAAAGRCTIVLNGAGSRTLTARFKGGTLFQASTGTTPHNVVVPNTPPTAVDDGYSATAGVTLSVSEADGVLANDSDPDDPMTAQVLTLPAHGSLTLNPNGSFDYLPNLTYFGQDSFTYQVNAGSATASATVRITVNLPPGP
jgi:hypothetical protein